MHKICTVLKKFWIIFSLKFCLSGKSTFREKMKMHRLLISFGNFQDNRNPIQIIRLILNFRASATAVGAYGELYLIGGRGNGTCNEEVGRSVEVFNTEYKQWRDLDQPIPVPR